MATRLQKSMLQPITVIFKFLTSKTRVVIWLYEQPATRIEGRLLGFDEFMNLVLEDAEEVDSAPAAGGARRGGAAAGAAPARRALGRILLKGDSVSLISAAPGAGGAGGAT